MKTLRNSYTLVEMLVVIAIAGILTTLAIPSFNRLMNGNKTVSAGNMLRGAIEQAQSVAITRRAHVAVILPNDTGVWNGKYAEFPCRAFRLALVTANGTTYTFKEWLPESRWQEFPAGVMLVQARTTKLERNAAKGLSSNSAVLDKISDSFSNLAPVLNIKDNGIDSGKTINGGGIVFSPYGEANATLYFALAEANVIGNDKILYKNRDDNGKPLDAVLLKLNQFTGRSSVE